MVLNSTFKVLDDFPTLDSTGTYVMKNTHGCNELGIEDLSRRDLIRLAGASALGISGFTNALAATSSEAATTKAKTNLPWPAVGCFASKVVVGPHRSEAKVMLDRGDLLGLPAQSAFIYGNVRDDEGNLSEWVRMFNFEPGATKQGLFVQSSAGADTLRAVPQIFAGAASEYEAGLEADTAVWKTAKGAKGKPFRVTMAADGSSVTWFEEGVLDLKGSLLGPGLQWHIPDPLGSELYVSQIYEMKGTALGKPVRGVIAFDKVHLPKGQMLYGGKDPLFRPTQHHRTWYTWGTRYKDGSYDAGHFVLGTDRMGFALLTNERQELVLDTDVTGKIELTPNEPWPRQVTVRTSSGVEWELLPDPKGRMPDMLGTGATTAFTPQTEGRWRRVGDRREPAVWFAWGEVAPRGRTEYSREYRI